MSTWRCGWICPRNYFFAAVFLAGARDGEGEHAVIVGVCSELR